MKHRSLVFVFALALCAGCSSPYRVTLTNGSYYTSMGKPHLNKEKSHYTFKDASGKQMEVSPLSVREIAPESMADSNKSFYQPKPSK